MLLCSPPPHALHLSFSNNLKCQQSVPKDRSLHYPKLKTVADNMKKMQPKQLFSQYFQKPIGSLNNKLFGKGLNEVVFFSLEKRKYLHRGLDPFSQTTWKHHIFWLAKSFSWDILPKSAFLTKYKHLSSKLKYKHLIYLKLKELPNW